VGCPISRSFFARCGRPQLYPRNPRIPEAFNWKDGCPTFAKADSGFPVELSCVGALHAAFLNESRTRGCWWRPVQEIRIRGTKTGGEAPPLQLTQFGLLAANAGVAPHPTPNKIPAKPPFSTTNPPFQQPSPCSSVNDLLLSQRSLKTTTLRNHHPRRQFAKFNEYWYYKKVVAVVTVELRGRALNSTHPVVASEAAVCSTGEISPYRSPEQAKAFKSG
jgi:hypothetical protein